MVDCSNKIPALFTSAASGSPFAIEAGEHRHHRLIVDVRRHGSPFYRPRHDLINDLCRGFDVVMKIHRNV